MAMLGNLIGGALLVLSGVFFAPTLNAGVTAAILYPYSKSPPPPKETCGISGLKSVSISEVLASRTLVFQDTSEWSSWTSGAWCRSATGVQLERGLLMDVTFMRKNDNVAFYFYREGKIIAVKWSKVNDPEIQAELRSITKTSVQWEAYYRAVLNEAARRTNP